MKRGILHALALAGFAALIVAGLLLWRGRPWRTAVSVNGRVLSVGELRMRGATLLEDARRTGSLDLSSGNGDEAVLRCRREAARLWVVKEVLLAEAVARGFTATPDDEKEALAQVAARLKGRNLTPDQFFAEGPLPEELKRRDFREGVLVNKFTAKEVKDAIVVAPAEVDARLAALKRESSGNPPSRKAVQDRIRVERFRTGFRRLFRTLYAKADVKSPEFPDLEKLEAVSPARPEDNDKMQESK